MKILYISDLDGTLLNSNAEVSDFTRKTLNKLIADGMHFCIATARTSATVSKMFESININMPVILMNGVCIFDLKKNTYIKIESIPTISKTAMIKTLKKYNLSGFLYTIDENHLSTFYENTDSPNAKAFIEERVKKFNKSFTKVSDFADCLNKNIVYYSISEKKEKLESLYTELAMDKNLHIEFYRDIYNEDFWYLEVCSNTASKYNAVNFLRKKYGYEKVISFGDNLNDLPLFLASDECYSVKNAKQEVKVEATGIIDSNNDDGVPKWLQNHVILSGM
jgi:HAD-superfamily hydrolase, subfamily IIB